LHPEPPPDDEDDDDDDDDEPVALPGWTSGSSAIAVVKVAASAEPGSVIPRPVRFFLIASNVGASLRMLCANEDHAGGVPVSTEMSVPASAPSMMPSSSVLAVEAVFGSL
jgi:hypothetical protein